MKVVRQGSSDGALTGNGNGEESTASEPRDGHVAADVDAGWKNRVETWLWLAMAERTDRQGSSRDDKVEGNVGWRMEADGCEGLRAAAAVQVVVDHGVRMRCFWANDRTTTGAGEHVLWAVRTTALALAADAKP